MHQQFKYLLLYADVATTRNLYNMAHELAHRLVNRCLGSFSTASSPDIAGNPERPASALPASPMSIQVWPPSMTAVHQSTGIGGQEHVGCQQHVTWSLHVQSLLHTVACLSSSVIIASMWLFRVNALLSMPVGLLPRFLQWL